MSSEEGDKKISEEEEYKKVARAEDDGDHKAKTKLAFFLLTGKGGAEVDEDRAFALLKERVKDRDTEAMWMLGLCYEYGIGCEEDFERAMSLYEQSRDGGNAAGKLLRDNVERGECVGAIKVKGLYLQF